MNFFQAIAHLASLAPIVRAASSWAGSNLYYAAGLTTSQQATLFSGLQSANVKVLRVWLDGESSPQKGTYFTSYSGLEGTSGPGASNGWNDDVLNRLDDFMDNAKKYGIKLTISIHSYNALENNADFYGKWYGTGNFYTDSNAISYYKSRINHVMNHVNPHNGKRWADSSEYIFSFETQNEAMHDNRDPSALVSWQCTMASAIKSNLKSNSILVSTGGGSYVDTSLQDGLFSCAALDVLAIHAYGTGDLTTSKLTPYVQKAQSHGKKLIMQEWGACYYSSANNRCDNEGVLNSSQRDANIKQWADAISKAGIPWQYWQILPNEDPHNDWDYEVGINGVNWGTLKSVAQGTKGYTAAFDFSQWLSL